MNSDIFDFFISDLQSGPFRQLNQGTTLWPQNKLSNRDTCKTLCRGQTGITINQILYYSLDLELSVLSNNSFEDQIY